MLQKWLHTGHRAGGLMGFLALFGGEHVVVARTLSLKKLLCQEQGDRQIDEAKTMESEGQGQGQV